MLTIKKQYYGIKFPFTAENNDRFFIDINEDVDGKLASEILHVILTPKGTRIRMPDFGTDLIRYIFSPNDDWESVRNEIVSSVAKYVHGVTVTDINVTSEENNNIYIDILYQYEKGNIIEEKRLAVRL